jgi:hypothetical protein
MKKITLIILLISTTLNAQIGNSFETATLNLRNEEIIKGEAKILGDGTIKFRKNNKSEKIIYTYRKVKKLVVYEDGINESYKYKIIRGKRPKLMKVIKEYPNKINLYGIKYSVAVGHGIGIGPISLGLTDNFYHYYVNKGNGDTVIKLGSSQQVYGSRHFKKTALKFFKDCPSLIKKIKDKEFNRRKHTEEIIDYYKNECE